MNNNIPTSDFKVFVELLATRFRMGKNYKLKGLNVTFDDNRKEKTASVKITLSTAKKIHKSPSTVIRDKSRKEQWRNKSKWGRDNQPNIGVSSSPSSPVTPTLVTKPLNAGTSGSSSFAEVAKTGSARPSSPIPIVVPPKNLNQNNAPQSKNKGLGTVPTQTSIDEKDSDVKSDSVDAPVKKQRPKRKTFSSPVKTRGKQTKRKGRVPAPDSRPSSIDFESVRELIAGKWREVSGKRIPTASTDIVNMQLDSIAMLMSSPLPEGQKGDIYAAAIDRLTSLQTGMKDPLLKRITVHPNELHF